MTICVTTFRCKPIGAGYQFLGGCLESVRRGVNRPWRQSGVLKGVRVRLLHGLTRTKLIPTSMPTTRKHSTPTRLHVSSTAGRKHRCGTVTKLQELYGSDAQSYEKPIAILRYAAQGSADLNSQNTNESRKCGCLLPSAGVVHQETRVWGPAW
jgi:hypothetical protein